MIPPEEGTGRLAELYERVKKPFPAESSKTTPSKRSKAGREAKGKMRTGWLWPVYGDSDEIVFHYAPSHAHRHVHALLGLFRGTLLSDGYEAYAAYAGQRPGEVTHAQCWSHTRRGSERANDGDPEAVAEALAMIGAMYGHEKQIRYLVDVLQRISMHPAKRAIELTPRMWKSLFADAPLRSDLGAHHHDPPSH